MKYLENPADLNSREELLRTYDELPMHEKYRVPDNEVDADQFFRVSERVRNQRKPRKVLDGSVINRNMRGAAMPPRKGAGAQTQTDSEAETDVDSGGRAGRHRRGSSVGYDGVYDGSATA